MATYSPVPSSTVQSATGSSYTVASGFYAIARCCVANGGLFKINSVTVMSTTAASWSVLSGSPLQYALTSGSNGLITENSGSTSAGSAYTTATASSQSDLSQTFTLVAGDNITGTAGGGTSAYHIEVYPL